jgi:two-component system response regulator YesN
MMLNFHSRWPKLKNSVTYKFYLKCYQFFFLVVYLVFLTTSCVSTVNLYHELTDTAEVQSAQNYTLFEDTLKMLDRISVNIAAQSDLRAYHVIQNLEYPYIISNLLKTTIRPYTVIRSLSLMYIHTSYENLSQYAFTNTGIQDRESIIQRWKEIGILPETFSLYRPEDITNRVYASPTQETTLYISQIPSSYPVSSGIILYELDTAELSRRIESRCELDSSYQIFDYQGNLIFQIWDAQTISHPATFTYEDPYRGSQAVYQVHLDSYYAPFFHQIFSFLLASILLAVFLVFLSFRLAAQTYRPIARLFSAIHGDTSDRVNEIQLLEGVLHGLQSENEKISAQMANQTRMIHEQVVLSLIHGEECEVIIEHLGDNAQIYLNQLRKYSVFCCVIATIDEYLSIFVRNRSPKEQWIDKHAVMSFLQQASQQYGYAVPTNIISTHSIITLFAGTDPTAIQEQVYQICHMTQTFIHENFDFTATFSIGWHTDRIDQIYLSYQDADFLTQYGLFLGTDTIVNVEKVDALLKQNASCYQNCDTQIQRIIKEIRTGKESAVQQSFSDFFEHFQHSGNVADFRLAYIDLLTAIKKLINQVDVRMATTYLYQLEQLYTIEWNSIEEMEQYTVHLGLLLWQSFSKNHPEEGINTGKYQQILDYITENLSDPNLCLDMIADHFSMNPSYLIRLFKSGSGKTLMKYVDELRFENSKTLLVGTNFAIKEIVRQVGYMDENNFSRKFRSREGITPQKYRDLYR